MGDVHLEISEMLEAGCSRQFMVGTLVSEYGFSAGDALSMIEQVQIALEAYYEYEEISYP